MPFKRSYSFLIIFLLTACTLVNPMNTSPSPSTKTPALDAQAWLMQMTPEQKLGQTLIIGFDGTTVSPALRQMIVEYHVGGVILFARNIESPQQVAQLCHDLQSIALESGHPGLLIAIDQEGGRVARLSEETGFTEFPGAMAIAATGDPDNANRVYAAMAAEMRAVGINVDFAPDLDVNNNPLNPVIGIRSFGSDPQQVSIFGVAALQGLQDNGVMAFGKHFPGHGDTGVDSHVSLPLVAHDRERLDRVELPPFEAAMQANVAGIMSAHVTFPAIDPQPGRPATLSQPVLTGLLRQQLGYQGLVVTDSLEMGALGEAGYPPSKAAVAAFDAGADLLLFNRDHALHRAAIDEMKAALANGTLKASWLDESVLRILQAKQRFGLLNPTLVDPQIAAQAVHTAEHQQLALEVAQQSITLLRDRGGLLPLQADEPLLVIEPAGGRGLAAALNTTYLQVSSEPTNAEIKLALSMARDGRKVIVVTADANRLTEQADLVNDLLAAGSPVIVIASRNPYDILAFPQVQTYLVSYGLNEPAIQALVSVLRGQIVAKGSLPVEIPGLSGQ